MLLNAYLLKSSTTVGSNALSLSPSCWLRAGGIDVWQSLPGSHGRRSQVQALGPAGTSPGFEQR